MKPTATKLMAVLLCLITALSLTFCAYADIIYEPDGNDFYDEHAEETSRISRIYTAIKDAGIYAAPTSKNKEGEIKTGVTVNIPVLWVDADGKAWGYVASTEPQGWTDMSAFNVVYDYISFEDDFGDKIVKCDEKVELKNPGKFYAYPGSVADDMGGDFAKLESLTASSKYTAPDGSEWYCCAYYYGIKNFWFTNATQEQIDAMSALVLEKNKQTAAQTTLATNPGTNVTKEADGTTVAQENTLQAVTTVPSAESTTLADAPSTAKNESRIALYLVIGLAVFMAVLIPVIMKRKKGSDYTAE